MRDTGRLITYSVGQILLTIGSGGIGAVMSVSIVRSPKEIAMFQATVAILIFLIMAVSGSLLLFYERRA